MIQYNKNIGINIKNPSASFHVLGTNSDANSIVFIAQNSNLLSILTLKNNGRVGILTDNPINTLDVNGNTNFRGNLYFGSLGEVGLFGWGSNGLTIQGFFSRGVGIGSNNVYDVLYVASSSNVGIGTINPIYKLDVVSATAISARFSGRVIGATAINDNEYITLGQLASSASNYFVQNGNSFGATAVLGTNDNNSLQFETNGSTVLTLKQNGFVGLGTNNPSKKLHVYGTTSIRFESSNGNYITGLELVNAYQTVLPLFGMYFYAGGGSIGNNVFNEDANNSPQNILFSSALGTGLKIPLKIGSADLATVSFYSNSLERMVIAATGNIGIGTASPQSLLHLYGNQAKLKIQNSGSGTNGIEFVDYSGGLDGSITLNQSSGEIRYYAAASYFPTFYSNNLLAMSIDVNRNINVTKSITFTQSGGLGYIRFNKITNTNDNDDLLVGYYYLGAYQFADFQTSTKGMSIDTTNNIVNIKGVLTVAATATIVGNVGIGTINPTTKLHIFGDTTIQAATNSSPAVLNLYAQNTSPNRASIIFKSPNGSNRNYIHTRSHDSGSNDGVFEFIATPINGGLYGVYRFLASDDSTKGITIITSATTSNGIACLYVGTGSSKFNIGFGGTDILSVYNSGNVQLPLLTGTQSDIMIISTTGSIGRTSSSALLSGNYFVQNGNAFGATATLGTNDNYGLYLETNGATRIIVATSGLVGIGITPTHDLTLGHGMAMYFKTAQLLISDNTYTKSEGAFIDASSDRSIRFGISDNNQVPVGINMYETNNDFTSTYINFRTGNIDSMFLDNYGNLGLGTTTPTYKLDVIGTFKFISNINSIYSTYSPYNIIGTLSAFTQSSVNNIFFNLQPTLITTTSSQIQTAFSVNATFTGSNTGTNIIADFSSQYGSMFSVLDGITGSIFNVNDITGFPILNATSDWDFNISDYPDYVFTKQNKNLYLGVTASTASNVIIRSNFALSYLTGTQSDLVIISTTGSISRTSSTAFMAGNYFAQDGNSFGATAVLGTNDNQPLLIKTNNIERLTILQNGDIKTATDRMRWYDQLGRLGFGITAGQTISGKIQIEGDDAGLGYRLTRSGVVASFATSPLVAGLFVTSNTPFVFTTNAIERVRISESGNVGIGSVSPAYTLDIMSTNNVPVKIASTASISYIQIQNASSGYSGSNDGLTIGLNGLDAYIYQREVANLIFGTSDTERMRITPTGNVGIGITPNYTLDVSSTASISARFSGRVIGATAVYNNEFVTLGQIASSASNYFFQNGNSFGATAVLGTIDNYSLQLNTNNSARITISATGNVGIGTATASNKFEVNGNIQIGTGQMLSSLFFTRVASSQPIRFSTTGDGFEFVGGSTYIFDTMIKTPTIRLNSVSSFSNGKIGLNIREHQNNTYAMVGSGMLPSTTQGAQFTIQSQVETDKVLVLKGLATQSANILEWQNSLSNPIGAITKDGYLGIGISSPTASLHVIGDGVVTGTIFTGNLIVTGTTSTLNSTNLSVKDAIIELATGQDGNTPLYDSGLIVNRGLGGSGSSANVAFIWKEDVDEFVLIGTGNTASVISVTISNYENLRLKNIYGSASSFTTNLNLGYLSGTQSDLLIVSSTGSVGKTSSAAFLSGNYFVQNGNTFGSNAVLGTNDTNSLIFETNNTNRIYISGTHGGVGIGTNTPLYRLHVIDNTSSYPAQFEGLNSSIVNIGANTKSGQSSIKFENSSVWSFIGIGGVGDTVPASLGISVNGVNPIIFNTAGLERMRIHGNGNVSIGTTSNIFPLDVKGSVRATSLYMTDANGYGYGRIFSSYWYTNGDVLIQPYGSTTSTLFSPNGGVNIGDASFAPPIKGLFVSGNVGINVSNTTYKLDVNGNVRMTSNIIMSAFTGSQTDLMIISSTGSVGRTSSSAFLSTNYFVQDGNTFGATATLGTNDVYGLQLEVNNIKYLTIATSGKIGIGSANINPIYGLDVSGGIVGAANFTVPSYNTILANNYLMLYGANGGGISADVTGNLSIGRFISSSLTTSVYINNSGNVGIGILSPIYRLDVSSTASISARFSGRVIGATAINNDEFITLGQLSASVSNYFVQNGNSFGSNAVLGTNDNYALQFKTNNNVALSIKSDGSIVVGNSGFGNAPLIYTSPNNGSNIDNNARKLAFVVQDGNAGTNFSFILNNPVGITTGTLNNILAKASITLTNGNTTLNQFIINPTLWLSGTYNGIVRGFYYDPLIAGTAVYTHNSIQTTSGDVVLKGGSVSIQSTTSTASGIALHIKNIDNNNLLTVKNNNDIIINQALLKSYVVNNIGTGSNVIATYSALQYQGGFINYYISSSTNSRTGQMMVNYNTILNTLDYTEVTSVDIGDTNTANIYATISNTDIFIYLTTISGTWSAKTFINGL